MKKISHSAYKILNDPRLLEKRERWFRILEDLFNGKSNDFLRERIPTINGWCGKSGFSINPETTPLAYFDPEAFIVECLEETAEYLASTYEKPWFEPICVEYGIYGVHFIDRIFGSNVFFHNHDQWGVYPQDVEIGNLKMPYIENSETWKMAKTAALAFAAQDVSVPLFGLPCIASTLNISINMFGANLLMDMIEEPEAAYHDMKIVNDVLKYAHNYFRGVLPSEQIKPVVSWQRTLPDGYGQLCGCSTQLLSEASYRDLVAPLDAELLDCFPHGGCIHLCGEHTQHLKTWANMPKLRAFQLNGPPALDVKTYFDNLRDDQILYLNMYNGVTSEMVIEVTGGERLVILDAIEPPKKPTRR